MYDCNRQKIHVRVFSGGEEGRKMRSFMRANEYILCVYAPGTLVCCVPEDRCCSWMAFIEIQ